MNAVSQSLPFLEQIAHDILAWERAEGIEVLHIWKNEWGIWHLSMRKTVWKGKRTVQEYHSIHFCGAEPTRKTDARDLRLVADLAADLQAAGRPEGKTVTEVAKLIGSGLLLVWWTDGAGARHYRKLKLTKEDDDNGHHPDV